MPTKQVPHHAFGGSTRLKPYGRVAGEVKLLEPELEAEPNDPSPEPDVEGIAIQLAISTRHHSRLETEEMSKTRFKGNVGKLWMAWGSKEGTRLLTAVNSCKTNDEKRQRMKHTRI